MSNSRWLLRFFFLISFAFESGQSISAAIADADFFVAPDGNDSWSGKLAVANADKSDGPFATLVQARDAVREFKKAHLTGIKVFVRSGTYHLPETLVFGLEDSGRPLQTITYAAYPGEKPILSGAKPILKWAKADHPSLPDGAKGHVWVAEILQHRKFRTLYQGANRLARARGEGFHPTHTTAWRESDQQVLHFPKGTMHNWSDAREGEIVIIPSAAWTLNILPIESVNEETLIARTTLPATYAMGWNHTHDKSVHVENILELLDEPGEWYLNSAEGKLFLWPSDGSEPKDIVAPILTELIRIEGQINDEAPEDVPVKNLAFEGFTFMHSDRYPMHGLTGLGLQHDWEMHDAPSAMFRLRGAENCLIRDCHFSNSGATGIRLDLHCRKNKIISNAIDNIGGAGIVLAGYGPGVKDVNKFNEVSNNHIHHIGQIYNQMPALFIWQSGENSITHNLIHHTPYTGIVISTRASLDPSGKAECSRTIRIKEKFTGSWWEREKYLHGRLNLVEHNDIHHVMQVTGDGNGVYISGTGRGNVIRENFVHDSPSPHMGEGIRCDDDQHETLMEGNILVRLGGMGTGICIKGINHIRNNIMANFTCLATARGMVSIELAPVTGSIIEHNIVFASRKDHRFVFQQRLYGEGAIPRLKECKSDKNIYFNVEDPAKGEEFIKTEQANGIEKHSLSADPLFVDLAKDDFRFQPGSPARQLGIKELDVHEMGLTKE